MKFKAGQRVMCVNKSGNPHSSLVIGEFYTVKYQTNRTSLYLKEEHLPGSWDAVQFSVNAEMENV